MRLYTVKTIAKQYGCKDVRFCWFRGTGDDRPRRRYTELIKDYDARDKIAGAYSEDADDELFTAIEANALKAYLDREHGGHGVTTIEEISLPIPNNTMGVGALSVGSGDGLYMLDRESQYTLPFKVRGYFNVVGCELVDAPGSVYHHRLMLVSRDGARMETNDDAALRERERPVESVSDTLDDDSCPF